MQGSTRVGLEEEPIYKVSSNETGDRRGDGSVEPGRCVVQPREKQAKLRGPVNGASKRMRPRCRWTVLSPTFWSEVEDEGESARRKARWRESERACCSPGLGEGDGGGVASGEGAKGREDQEAVRRVSRDAAYRCAAVCRPTSAHACKKGQTETAQTDGVCVRSCVRACVRAL
ncbi:hypothetical protein L1887_59942 [Cichorium endivia]|nr:hypothetical protein L1887_59942 [Cichorium endivia]